MGPSGKGKRLIIAHIGSKAGFVEGCLSTFESKKSGGYHEEICAEIFEKWFQDVLPRLQENAVIVLDNALYHSRRKEKVTNANSNKHEISEWLKSKNIDFEDGMLKKELLDIVKNHRTVHNEYAIDEMAKNARKTVLRIPPYHCELNAIELVWPRIKGYVAAKNKTYKMPEVEVLLEEAVRTVTAEDWNKCVLHVLEKVETQNVEIRLRNGCISGSNYQNQAERYYLQTPFQKITSCKS
ncbi:uncharacterized protein LOC126252124 [Schistocerca nitens]|uniref:uncharacterized protein LOC126252124 n=1 Tax=Schistocerca nitens TaxID=7011 RepID=UPI0021184A0B|nr:uncharacterized protein LOC126252124 [Schistocerca nitens]